MFLATDVLTADERNQAFSEAPLATDLSLGYNVASNLVRDGALELVDTLLGQNYVTEALGALLDGSLLLVRAAGQISESRAAELYVSRVKPRGWLARSADPPEGSEADRKLRLSLIEMPLHEAGTLIDAAINHFANAILRLGFEVNLPEPECRRLGLDTSIPVTDTRQWIGWSYLRRQVQALPRGSLWARFSLVKSFLASVEDADFVAASEYRHGVIHREIPAGLDGPYVRRASANATGHASLDLMRREKPIVLPDLKATRSRIASALGPCRTLQLAILDFLPDFASASGFRISITGTEVAIAFDAHPGRLQTPVRVIYDGRGRPVSVGGQGTLQTKIVARALRNPGQFLSP